MTSTVNLSELDHAHVWHPFTPMRQWRETPPLIIERAQGEFLIDTDGQRYIDGVSSLWCNVHGHRVPEIDQAIRDQLDKVAHSTLLGLGNVPSIELAARLCAIAPGRLNKVFYSDAGATATEVAFKMAVGYWYHRGEPQRHTLVALQGAYHGDTHGAMSVGYSDLFHRPFKELVFHTELVPAPHVFHTQGLPAPQDGRRRWSLEHAATSQAARDAALTALEGMLATRGSTVAAIVVEPLVQGAAGMVMQPEGYLKGVEDLARRYGVLLVADEVATGFGRTGKMFACEHEGVEPDILCLAKGITGGYLPLAATLATDQIEQAFTGELDEHRTLYHGHTYTGNPLACAAALASLDLFEKRDVLAAVNAKAQHLARRLDPLRDPERFPFVADVRQRGLMVGIELAHPEEPRRDASPEGADRKTGFDPTRRLGYEVCDACRPKGVIIRPLGNVVILMPPLAIEEENLDRLADTVIESIGELQG